MPDPNDRRRPPPRRPPPGDRPPPPHRGPIPPVDPGDGPPRGGPVYLPPPAAPVVPPRPSEEAGPSPIAGYTLTQSPQALPQLDTTAGARQRYFVSVPNVHTRMLMGSRVPSAGAGRPGNGYDGFNVVTNGHLYLHASNHTATVTAQERIYLGSMTGSLAAIANGDVLVGSQRKTVTVGAHQNVMLVGGYGPTAQAVSVWGTTPESPAKPDFDEVVSAHREAALISTGCVTAISAGLQLIGTKRAVRTSSVVGYVLLTASLLSGFRAIAEGSSKSQLFTGFDPDEGLPPGVGIHGKGHITMTTGFAGSISSFAHTGSITSVAGITAGLMAGIAANISGGLVASVTGLATANMSSIMSSNIVSVLEASLESRKGVALVRGATVEIGDLAPPAPQLPTLSVETAAIAVVRSRAGGPGGPEMTLDAVSQEAEVKAIAKVTIDVAPFSVEVTPLGVHIKYAGDSVVEVTPLKIVLKQLSNEVEVALDGVTLKSGPSSVKVTAAAAKVSATKVLLG